MKVLSWMFWMSLAGLLIGAAATADPVEKAGFTDYACHNVNGVEVRQDGMPDFDQKQDGWFNGFGQWVWCGPVAASNCLWWFDSKFEMIRCKSIPQPPVCVQRPPLVSDHYSLVHSLVAGFDDHDPLNLIPFITLLGTQPPGVGMQGITAQQMKTMIENYLALPAVNLWGHYNITIVGSPTYEYIYEQVRISQDVILLLGFWQNSGGQWFRVGGHWLTVCGVDSQNNVRRMGLSDPMWDGAEMGAMGTVWDGFMILPHTPLPPHLAMVHNDAGNVSHDWYQIGVSNSPGGSISPIGYGEDFDYETWQNFQGLNVPDHLQQYQGQYDPTLPVHCEEEGVVVICPNFDYGDLHQDYPTIDIESCGPAHPLTDKAWLGEGINAEVQPRIDTANAVYDLDQFDDGVQFIGLPWMPCQPETVNVIITVGQHYAGEALYLNAWKDGNIDGDFDDGPTLPPEDDYLCCSEWLIQDAIVGTGIAQFTFCDPGDSMMDPYDLRIRFRLTSQPVGRFGYGGYWGGGVSNGWGTYDIDWTLGEVEDYILEEMQLAVELRSFEAVPGDRVVELAWVTASEENNDLFTLARRTVGSEWSDIVHIASYGSSSTDQRYSYCDAGLDNGRLYEYRLSATDIFGQEEVLAVRSATPTAAILPTEYSLAQNYPNPFNASTEISYAIAEAGHVTLTVFNSMGQVVTTLVDAEQTVNAYTVSFDASTLPSGIYVYALSVNGFSDAKKLVLIK